MIRIMLIASILLTTAGDLNAQLALRQKNKYDAGNHKHGYWVTYSRTNPTQKTFKGWYKNGAETRRCQYYLNGKKCMKLRYVNDSLIKIVRYNSCGKPEYKGTALWLVNKDEMRYCWNGEFTFYGENRKMIRKAMYIKGEEIDPLEE